ncbi:MAG: beta-lactamase family protein [Clostridia bacterium]|nr:beta-lactamase family protein [Clostridia bacterium]
MTPFEKLTALLEEKAPGAYMAAEMTENSRNECMFRPGQGAQNIYSISKSVTGCAVGILHDEGKLSDSDRVYDVIGHLFPEKFDKRWKEVSLEDVMLHRTGVSSEANIDIDVMDFRKDGNTDFLKFFLSQPIVHDPGKGPFIYCDTNYYLIGRIVEEVAGKTLAEFLQERMFNPLGWIGNAWGTCPLNHTLGGTGLFVRAGDLAAYGLMLGNGGVFGGQRILSEKWIEKARGKKGCYGYGFTNSADGRWFMAGGMLGQGVYVFPETRRAFSVLGHDVPLELIGKEIVPAYLEKEQL